MTTVDITPAKRRFGKRKQWKFTITAGGNDLSPNDTYANPLEIVSMLRNLRDRPVRVRVHYEAGVKEIDL